MQRKFKDIVQEQIPPQIIMVISLVIILVAGYCVWITTNSGNIEITTPIPSSEIYVDGSLLGTSSEAGQKLTFSFSAGYHDIIVSRPGFWPWTQAINLEKDKTTELFPFLIPQKPNTAHLPAYIFDGVSTRHDPEYLQKMAVFETLSTNESLLPILKETNIQDIRFADFFPERTDVLIVSAGKTVFALDIKNTKPRNYEPIFEGTAPVFFKASDNTLYIKDGESLYHVTGLVPTT